MPGRVPIRYPHLRYPIAMALPPLSDVTILRQVEPCYKAPWRFRFLPVCSADW